MSFSISAMDVTPTAKARHPWWWPTKRALPRSGEPAVAHQRAIFVHELFDCYFGGATTGVWRRRTIRQYL